jgi:hypothetical protein
MDTVSGHNNREELMKPENWDKMSFEEKQADIRDLFGCGRGGWVVWQTLCAGVEALRQQEHPPLSDIEDVETIMEVWFPTAYLQHRSASACDPA